MLRFGVTHILQTGLLSLLELHHLFKVEICKPVHNAYCLHAPNHKLLKKARVVNPAGKVQNNERTATSCCIAVYDSYICDANSHGEYKTKI